MAIQPTSPPQPLSGRMVASMIALKPILSEKWDYDWGVTLTGVEHVWRQTKNPAYFDYIKSNIDRFVLPDGSIPKYRLEEYNLDRINTGKLFFMLYDETGDERYLKGLHLLRRQLDTQPRNSLGGFWHKQIYPTQMWLDGLYMAGPFYASYAARFDRPAGFRRHRLADRPHGTGTPATPRPACSTTAGMRAASSAGPTRKPAARPTSGAAPWAGTPWPWLTCWSSSPASIPSARISRPSSSAWLKPSSKCSTPPRACGTRCSIKATSPAIILKPRLPACSPMPSPKPCAWASCPPQLLEMARRAWQGIQREFIREGEDGLVYLEKTCGVAGLGGDPYRDGSYDYYVGEKQVTNDPKGVGAFLMAAVEMGD